MYSEKIIIPKQYRYDLIRTVRGVPFDGREHNTVYARRHSIMENTSDTQNERNVYAKYVDRFVEREKMMIMNPIRVLFIVCSYSEFQCEYDFKQDNVYKL